jgi:polyisoprenoid-binding protein YceI
MPRARLAVMLVAAVLVVGGGFLAWQTFFGGDEPEAVSLDSAIASLGTSTATASARSATGTASPPASGATSTANAAPSTPTAAATGAPPSATGLARTWALDPASSFVGYRVVEELVGIGAATAVGRTSDVTGSLVYDGAAITAVSVTAQMNTLKSDESRRDNALRSQSLETNRYPTATFELSTPIPVGQATEGQRLATSARGNLTLHGVTRAIELPLEGQFAGGRVVVVGSTEVAFADYGIAPPRAPAVLSVEDRGILELQLVFVPA